MNSSDKSTQTLTWCAQDIEWLYPATRVGILNDAEALGLASWLWQQSPLHRDWPIGLMSNNVWPAIERRQFLVARQREGRPLFYVSWAWLDDERERQYLHDTNSLRGKDWQSGQRLWFIDWIAPFGGTQTFVRHLRKEIFPHVVAWSLRVNTKKKSARIQEHFGNDVTPEQRQEATAQLQKNLSALRAIHPEKARQS